MLTDEKRLLIKAAYSAVREMEETARAEAFTFATACNMVFNAVLECSADPITPADLEAAKVEAN